MANAEGFKYINVNGARLAYRESGRGDPVVLVHANISDIRSWNPLENLLAEDYRVIAYSRRYAWPNGGAEEIEDDPWDVHVDDLAELILKLNLAPTHVVGNSTGAYLALLLSIRRPELLQAIILEEPPVATIFLPDTPPSIWQILSMLWNHPQAFLPMMLFGATVIGPTIAAFKSGDNERALRTFGEGVLGKSYFQRLSESRLEQMRANVLQHRAVLLGKGLPRLVESDVKLITTPTLLLTAVDTPAFQKAIDSRLAELISGAREELITNASHLIHEDNPAETAKAIKKFLVSIQH